MAGINAKLPLHRDDADGIGLNKDLRASTRQNLILLLMTIPGERPMDTQFGVGIPRYTFELDNPMLRGEISSEITKQVSIYMPFVEIILVELDGPEAGLPDNSLRISIKYNIIPLDAIGQINISIKLDPSSDRILFEVDPTDIDLT